VLRGLLHAPIAPTSACFWAIEFLRSHPPIVWRLLLHSWRGCLLCSSALTCVRALALAFSLRLFCQQGLLVGSPWPVGPQAWQVAWVRWEIGTATCEAQTQAPAAWHPVAVFPLDVALAT